MVLAHSGWSDADGLDANCREVKELVSFLDGSIMVPEVRYHLWRSWGFCPRHTWIQVAVEIELRGGWPFGTTILYQDLVGRARRLLAQSIPPDRIRIRRLESRDACYTCDYLALGGSGASYTERSDTARTEIANRRERIAELIRNSLPEWKERSCPTCLGGSGPVCRQHLLAGEPAELFKIADALGALFERMELFHRSMTWRGPVVGPAERASWVEALGWFAGWEYPAALIGVPVLSNPGNPIFRGQGARP